MKCTAFKKDGSPCGANAKANGLCNAHDPTPESVAAFRAGQSVGGSHNKKPMPAIGLDIEIDPNNLDSSKAAVAAEMTAMVRTQRPGPKTLHALCDGARTIVLLEERSTLKAQLDRIERRLDAQRNRLVSDAEVEELRRLDWEQKAELEKREQLRVVQMPEPRWDSNADHDLE